MKSLKDKQESSGNSTLGKGFKMMCVNQQEGIVE